MSLPDHAGTPVYVRHDGLPWRGCGLPPGEASPRAAQHESERRRRLAAAASLPLDRPLSQAMDTLFQSVQRLDELAGQAEAQPQGDGSAGALRALQHRLNDALQHCDRLATQVDHVQRLLGPALPMPRRFNLRSALARALYGVRDLLPERMAITERLGPLPPVMGDRSEITQVLIDCLLQLVGRRDASGQVLISGAAQNGVVSLALQVEGAATPAASPGLALESAIETLARHRGTLEVFLHPGQGTRLHLRLPAGA
jgi:signal transduction histidine kinase